MAARIRSAQLLSACVQLAAAAGEVIRRVQASGTLSTQLKGLNDPVTEADFLSQKLIESTLKWAFPEIRVLGEEEVQVSESDILKSVNLSLLPDELVSEELRELDPATVTVWVDPLDGTINFTKGDFLGCTTLIGIAVGDRPLFGVIHHVFAPQHPTYWGGHGIGLYKSVNETLEKVIVPPPPDTFVLISTFYHDSEEVTAFLQSIGADTIQRVGGTGFKALKVLLGEVSVYAYASSSTSKWDICGPEALVTALPGGALTDMRGELYAYGSAADAKNLTGLVVSRSPAYHEKVLQAHRRNPFIV